MVMISVSLNKKRKNRHYLIDNLASMPSLRFRVFFQFHIITGTVSPTFPIRPSILSIFPACKKLSTSLLGMSTFP